MRILLTGTANRDGLGGMRRIGLIFLPALALGSLMACERVDPASTNEKLAEIDKRLANIEVLLEKGAAQRPAAARPQRPPGPDASAVYAVPVEWTVTSSGPLVLASTS